MGWGGRRLWTGEDVLVLQGVGKFRFSSCYDIPYMMCLLSVCVCVCEGLYNKKNIHSPVLRRADGV